MGLDHLKFFDKNGNNCTPNLVDGIFHFDLYFDPVSTGLFSSLHLFILEEIIKEYEGSYWDKSKRGTYTPLLIRIMRYMYDYGAPIKKGTLERFFPTLRDETDYVDLFMRKNSNYILGIYDGNDVYYSLKDAGTEYLRVYNEKESETFLDNERRIPELVCPRSNYDLSAGEDTYLYFKWKDERYDKNVFIYYIDQRDETIYYDGDKSLCLDEGKRLPSIVPVYDDNLIPDVVNNPDWKKWYIPYRFDDGRDDSFLDIKESGGFDTKSRRVIRDDIEMNQKPFQINIALNSDTEGVFSRTLEIYAIRTTNSPIPNTTESKSVTNIYKVAEVGFHGEVIGEDERLRLLLENFGRQVEDSDAYIFRDSDIEEDLPDYIKINEKRKELLLVGDEIYPYVGSYKAFVNAIKFFGYHDIRLKEYFVNLKFSSPALRRIYYTAVEVPLDLKVEKEYKENYDFNKDIFGSLLDNKIYQKTSRFGLYYDINQETGDFDEYGFPIVEDTYLYTNEEILIKLYGLIKQLQKYYLPHHARIIDITGEGIYFAKYKLKEWNDQLKIDALRFKTNPNFEAEPLKGFIKPLDRLLNIFYRELDNRPDIDTFDRYEFLNNLLDKSLYEFITGGSTDFPFDDEIPIETIRKYYADYWSLKAEIFIHLKQSLCPVKYVNRTEDTYEPLFIEKRFVESPYIPLYEYTPTGQTAPTGIYLPTGPSGPTAMHFPPNPPGIYIPIGPLGDGYYVFIGPESINYNFDNFILIERTNEDTITGDPDYIIDIQWEPFSVLVYGPTGANYTPVVTDTQRDVTEVFTRAIEHTFDLMGQPTLIRLLPDDITWNDLDAKWDYTENELGPQDLSASDIQKLETSELERYNFSEMSIDDQNKLRKLIFSGSRLFQWDYIGYYGSHWMEWYIRHEDGIYCYKVRGTVTDIQEILVFLPHIGWYDVTVTLYDNNNFPRIRTKKHYIEVLGNKPDFVALGRHVKTGDTWDDFSDVQYKNFNGTWKYGSFCDIVTTWNECNLSWNDLHYATYRNQNFVDDHILYSTVVDYNTNDYKIVLNGRGYWESYNDYGHQKQRNVIVLERYPEKVPTYKNIRLHSLGNKAIKLYGQYDIQYGEKINVYNHVITNQMVIVDNDHNGSGVDYDGRVYDIIGKVNINTEYDEGFNVNKNINLIHGSSLLRETYRIESVKVDYVDDIIRITLNNDGSLLDIPYNKIEFRGGDYLFKVVSSEVDYSNNITTVYVDDDNGYLRDIRNATLEDYKAEWGIYSGRYVFDVLDVKLTPENNTEIRILPDDNICNITTSFDGKWALDFEYDWAYRFGNSQKFYWENLSEFSWDRISGQTWDMLEYHNQPILGFKIYDIVGAYGWIEMDGIKREFTISDSVPNEDRLYWVAKYYNNLEKNDCFKDFTYTVVQNDYIQVTHKSGGFNGLKTLRFSANITHDVDSTYPLGNTNQWQNYYYKGDNYPPMWNYLSYNKDEEELFWPLTGAFNYNDAFVKSEDFTIPTGTTLFIVYNNFYDKKNIKNEYAWELWDELHGKLLLRSNKRYLVWNFVTSSSYTVKLSVTENGNTRTHTKKSWITVT